MRRSVVFRIVIFGVILAAGVVPPGAAEMRPVRVFSSRGMRGPVVLGWDYDTDGDGKADFCRRDTDGDGVVDLYLYDDDRNGSFEKEIRAPRKGTPVTRHLIVFADSVPFSLMEKLWREGRFRDFFPPGRMISTFPSDTNPAFTEMMGTEKPPGVEDRYYDRAANAVRGGFMDHVKGRNASSDKTFHSVFGYEQNPRYGALIYLAPYLVSDHDLEKFEKTFRKLDAETPPGTPLILYVGSTDAIGHREGARGMTRQLEKLDGILADFIRRKRGKLRISLFSDHGNNLVRSERMIDLAGWLKRNGYRLRGNRLRGPKDVVAPHLGLVNEVNLYTRRENRAPLADILRKLEGVDFVIYRSDEAEFMVADATGRARITREGSKYRYEIIDGDPLDLKTIIDAMRERGLLDGRGFADDGAWFEATKAHRYPDILRRLVTAMTNHIVNRPDLYLSLRDGYCYGTPLFLHMIDLKGTHGSALAGSTNGIAMDTTRRLPDYLRAADLMSTVGERKPGGGDGPRVTEHESRAFNAR